VTLRRTITVAVAVVLGLAIAGCGGGSNRDAVGNAGASLGRIHSGALHLKLELSTGSADPSSRIGFEMDGSFDLALPGTAMPVADLTSTNLSDPSTPKVHFLSTGHAAFIVKDTVGYQLTDEQLATIRSDASKTGSGTFKGLDLQQWVVDPVQQPATTVAGEPVERVTGRVDPVAALNGMVALAGQLGAGQDSSLRVSDAEANLVRAAAQSSAFEVLTGRDGLLRSLTAQIEFAAQTTDNSGRGAVLAALRKLGHVRLTIELRIERPNTPVSLEAPATVRPIADLPKG
jgi:hypothetical protein